MKGLICAPILSVMIHSCGPSATCGGFDSPNPAAKMYAIERAARDGDRGAIKDLIHQLNSDDPAVRSMAIAALYRLTGETYGYRDYDPPHLRRHATQRWLEALRADAIPSAPAAAGQHNQESASDHG